jgi:hypothetical protein
MKGTLFQIFLVQFYKFPLLKENSLICKAFDTRIQHSGEGTLADNTALGALGAGALWSWDASSLTVGG